MTACVNDNQKKGGYGKAVSATLAGVLAVGMVPATALAADGDATVTSDEGIDLLTVSDFTAIEQGSITAATDAAGKKLSSLSDISFTANGENQYATPTQITPKNGEAITIAGNNDFAVAYYEAGDSSTGTQIGTTGYYYSKTIDLENDGLDEVGSYLAVVTYTDSGDGSKAYFVLPFSIAAQSLNGASIFEVNDDDPDDTSDTTFVYNGSAPTVGVVLNGEIITDDVTVKYRNSQGVLDDLIADAGTYNLIITGNDDTDFEGQQTTATLVVSALDLSAAKVTMSVPAAATPALSDIKVNGIAAGTLSTGIAGPTWVSGSNGSTSLNSYVAKVPGTYTYSIEAKAGQSNVTGSTQVSFDVVGTTLTVANNNFLYDDADVKNETYYLGSKTVFDASKISVENGSDTDIPFTVTYTNAKTDAPATAADLQTPGVWDVTVTVKGADTDYKYAGEATFTVTVWKGSAAVNANQSLYVKWDGELVADGATETETYDGSDWAKQLEVILDDGNGNALVQGTDFDVTITDEDDNEVTSIVNAGTYEVTVTSSSYNLTNVTDPVLTITVDPIDLTTIALGDPVENDKVQYTGSAIVPEVLDRSDSDNPVAIPEDAYSLTYTQTKDADGEDIASADQEEADEMVGVGTWKVTVVPNEENVNYDWTGVTGKEFTVEVVNDQVFVDVPPTEWYFADVNEANALDYMYGYNNSDIFGPNDAIKRGDVAVVIGRMAGVIDAKGDADDSLNNNTGYATPFTDVDPGMYYAKAIAWCANTGIVTGYGDTGLFMPEAPVTREEFATMLARYAKVYGDDITAADDVLDAYADASAVADWAKDYVAWAVSDKIMGVNTTVLWPTNKVSRAEVAAMAVRYQPEKRTNA